MKPQELTVTTRYTKDAPDVQQIILNSLAVFIKRELNSIAIPHTVLYDKYDEWPLISGGMRCT